MHVQLEWQKFKPLRCIFNLHVDYMRMIHEHTVGPVMGNKMNFFPKMFHKAAWMKSVKMYKCVDLPRNGSTTHSGGQWRT